MFAGRLAALGVGILAATVLSACSNNEPTINKRPHPGTSTAVDAGGVQQVTVTTGVDLRFHPSTIVVHAGGKVRITLVNDTGKGVGPPHDLKVTGLPGAFVPLEQPHQRRSVTFTAPSPGRYEFVCTIHATQGQTGTLVVLSA